MKTPGTKPVTAMPSAARAFIVLPPLPLRVAAFLPAIPNIRQKSDEASRPPFSRATGRRDHRFHERRGVTATTP